MTEETIRLKILLPFMVFREVNDVKRMVVETSSGMYGFLPRRLDCTAAIVPGILTYESGSEGEVYVALDEGILVKAGTQVFVSVRNAVGGKELGQLHKIVQQEFLELEEKEKESRSVLARLESSFIRQMIQLQKQ